MLIRIELYGADDKTALLSTDIDFGSYGGGAETDKAVMGHLYTQLTSHAMFQRDVIRMLGGIRG